MGANGCGLHRWPSLDEPGVSFADRKLYVEIGREKMPAAKAGVKKPPHLGHRFLCIEILDRIAVMEAIMEHQPRPLFEFDGPDRNPLQLMFGAFIIAQSQLNERAAREAFLQFGNEVFDLDRHSTKRLAHMGSTGIQTEQASIGSREFVESVAYLLRETFEGSPEGMPSAYLDRGTGMFSTLENLSAEEASKDVNGTTIAAHTEHAKFYLDRLCEFINGRTEAVNWEDSWLIETVSDEEWKALQGSVQRAYERTLLCLAEERPWTEMQVGMAIGLVAHTAYHLGSIRQMVKNN